MLFYVVADSPRCAKLFFQAVFSADAFFSFLFKSHELSEYSHIGLGDFLFFQEKF